MKYLLLTALTFTRLTAFCQEGEVFIVEANTLNVRSGPGTNYDIVHQLKQGQEIVITEVYNSTWYKIDLGFGDAYVYSKLITNDPDWTSKYLSSGTDPNCDNITPRYDKEIDNYLEVTVGSNTDVVVKLMRMNNYGGEQCVRIVYIRSKDSYRIANIPEGKYYLKIAYGKDWRQKTVDGRCYGKFMRRPLYEKGKEILDYNLVRISNGYNIPLYELSLDVVETDFKNSFRTNEISESEFNN